MSRWSGALSIGAYVLFSVLAVQQAAAADLDVTITGIKPGPGSIRVALYADPASFRHEDRAFSVLSVPAESEVVKVQFQNISADRYALLAYHDENGNRKLDLILGMFPDEGWGLSNDPDVLGPPSFEASAFDVTDPSKAITVPLHY